MSEPRYDWPAIERDYITGELSLPQIALKWGPSQCAVKLHSKAGRWYEKREAWRAENHARALERIGEECQDAIVAAETEQKKAVTELIEEIRATIAEVKATRAQGRKNLQSRASTLAQLSSALSNAVKTDRLLSNAATEIVGEPTYVRVMRACGIRYEGDDEQQGLEALEPQGAA